MWGKPVHSSTTTAWPPLNRATLSYLLLLAACLLLSMNEASASETASVHHTPRPRSYSRSYKAAAYITVFSIPVLSRSDVGGGSAAIDETDIDDQHTVRLQFVSGSLPARAHGLNRMGFIQEFVTERKSSIEEAVYFGFMTSSQEQTLTQAKAALAAKNKDMVSYTAAKGSATAANIRYNISHFLMPSSLGWTDSQELARQARQKISSSQSDPSKEIRVTSGAPQPRTFLYAVREAILNPRSRVQLDFIHNGKSYRLYTEKSNDLATGNELTERRLTSRADRIVKLTGKIQNIGSHEETTFKLWFDEASSNVLPLRFEFRPKSYLRLVFEADPEAPEPARIALVTQDLR